MRQERPNQHHKDALTEADLRRFKRKKPYTREEHPDGTVRGLYCVVQPSGAISWAVRYRHNGTPRKLTLEGGNLSLKAARKEAKKALGRIADGEDPAGAKIAQRQAQQEHADPDSVASVVTLFLRRHVAERQNARSAVETEALLRRFVLPAWSDKKLAQIRRRDVHDLLDSIVDGGAPVSANRVLSILKVLWGFALDREIVDSSPVAGFRKKHAELARERTLTDSELIATLRAAGQMNWPSSGVVKLLIATGCRRSEVAGMRWSEVDLANRLWSIPSSRRKGAIPHVVALNDLAMEVLGSLPRFTSDWVFPARVRADSRSSGHFRAYSKLKARLDALSGIEGATLHDIRRTVATKLQSLGIKSEVIEAVLGHKRQGIQKVYQRHDYLPEKKAALDLWARHLQHLLDPTAEEGKVVALSR